MQPTKLDLERGDRSSESRARVSLYSVNGLYEEPTNWLGKILPRFSDETGIEIDYVEDHSRAIVARVADQGATPGPDVLITLSPFIQMAAKEGRLAPYRPAGLDPAKGERADYHLLIRNYPDLICYGGPGAPIPHSYTDLLEARYQGRIRYSKPGWSGAGTAFLLQVFRAFGGRDGGLDYLLRLQRNCVAPSAHTQGSAALINGGELFVANGDLQTNYPQLADHPNMRLVIPAAPDGKRYVYEFSYYLALLKDAPNPDGGKALIDFLYSEYAQSMITDVVQGLPARRDVVTDSDTYRAFTAILEGVEYWEPDWDEVVATLDADVKAYERIVLGA